MQNIFKELSAQRLIHVVLFDVVWFLAVWGRADFIGLTGVLVVVLYAVNWRHLVQQLKALVLFVLTGLVAELTLVYAGVLKFSGTDYLPLWLVVLWLGFAATAFTSMDWMARRYGLALLFGLVFGPITYLAGVRFDAAELLVNKLVMVSAYGFVWAVLMLMFARLVTFYRAKEQGINNA